MKIIYTEKQCKEKEEMKKYQENTEKRNISNSEVKIIDKVIKSVES